MSYYRSFHHSYECYLCRKFVELPYTNRVYNVPGWIPVLERPAWCWVCDDLVPAEFIPTPAEILAEVRAFLRQDRSYPCRYPSAYYRGLNDRPDHSVSSYDDVFVWRQWRRSLERCLQCATEWISLPADPDHRPFEHPGCGGFFHPARELTRVFGRPPDHMERELYSSEGFLIQRELRRWDTYPEVVR